MAEAGAVVASAGADVVDVNLGCPGLCGAKERRGRTPEAAGGAAADPGRDAQRGSQAVFG